MTSEIRTLSRGRSKLYVCWLTWSKRGVNIHPSVANGECINFARGNFFNTKYYQMNSPTMDAAEKMYLVLTGKSLQERNRKDRALKFPVKVRLVLSCSAAAISCTSRRRSTCSTTVVRAVLDYYLHIFCLLLLTWNLELYS